MLTGSDIRIVRRFTDSKKWYKRTNKHLSAWLQGAFRGCGLQKNNVIAVV